MAIVSQFTDEQLQIIEDFGRRQGVVAGAGCGKTATMVGKCVATLKRSPDARLCAVSFTEKSALELALRIEADALRSGVEWDKKKHRLGTLHGLCGAILREHPRAAGLEGGERILPPEEAAPLWTAAMERLWWGDEASDVEDALALLLKERSVSVLTKLLTRLREVSSFGAIERLEGLGARPDVDALVLVFRSVAARYKTAKRRRGGIDFQDLEVLADLALQDKKIASLFHDTFDLVIVDEFQDINPIQERIVRAVARPDGSNLCVVGDPKQSIYRFRDADVSLFEDFIASSKRFELKKNFRSRPEILEFVNNVCAPAFQGVLKDYDHLAPGREFPPVAEPVVGRLPYQSIEELAVALSKTDTRGLTILSRSTGGNTTELLRHLRSLQVPVLIQSGGKFWSDPRVQEVVAFLKAWENDQNRLSAHAALRSPWLAVTDSSLEAWLRKEGASFSAFLESDHPVVRLLSAQAKIRDHVRPGEILEVLLGWEGLLEEMRMVLLQLWHRAEELSSAGRTFSEVTSEFERNISEGTRDREIPPPLSNDALMLMTIHASKGLEFERVLLLDFEDKTPRTPGGSGFIWNRKHGAFLNYRNPAPRSEEAAANDRWKEIEARERILEGMRVLYVAITRPKEKLYLYWPKGKDKEESERKPLYTEENWRRWVQAGGDLPVVEFEEVPAVGSVDTVSAVQEPSADWVKKEARTQKWFRPRHSYSEWKDLSFCEQLYAYRWRDSVGEEETSSFFGIEHSSAQQSASSEPLGPGVSAREFGSLLHSHLETENLSAIEALDSDLAARIAEINREHRLFSSYPKTRSECAFEIPLSRDEALVGVIDRLDWDPERQVARIIDYKWTARATTPKDLVQRYEKQIQMYAFAAQKLLAPSQYQLELALIHFSPQSAQWIPIEEDSKIQEWIQSLWKKASDLANHVAPPKKRADPECKMCPFLEKCRPFS
jgi:ATP-dependent exoDNAse (exonuclease V) beta subunit